MVPIVTYSVVESIENEVSNQISSIYGKSQIYLSSSYYEEDNKLLNIKKYLKDLNKKSSLTIKRKALLVYNDPSGKKYNKVVTVLGISDFDIFIEKNKIRLYKDEFFIDSGIFIGDDLAYQLGFPEKGSIISIISPLDGVLFPSSNSFRYLDQNFVFEKINSIDHFENEFVFIDYAKALDLFHSAKSYLSLPVNLSRSDLEYIRNNIADIDYRSWENLYPLFFRAIKFEKYLYTGFGFIIIFIICINFYGLVNLLLHRKRKQITMLSYLGMDSNKIKVLFILTLLSLSFTGMLFGVFLSYLMAQLDIINLFVPILNSIDISYSVVVFSLVFNFVVLYLSIERAFSNNICNIEVLKLNAIKG
tara:strand:+ start:3280 stop:4362 length:1083 start_codon:yes stop_codon:yes gene_type:complete